MLILTIRVLFFVISFSFIIFLIRCCLKMGRDYKHKNRYVKYDKDNGIIPRHHNRFSNEIRCLTSCASFKADKMLKG